MRCPRPARRPPGPCRRPGSFPDPRRPRSGAWGSGARLPHGGRARRRPRPARRPPGPCRRSGSFPDPRRPRSDAWDSGARRLPHGGRTSAFRRRLQARGPHRVRRPATGRRRFRISTRYSSCSFLPQCPTAPDSATWQIPGRRRFELQFALRPNCQPVRQRRRRQLPMTWQPVEKSIPIARDRRRLEALPGQALAILLTVVQRSPAPRRRPEWAPAERAPQRAGCIGAPSRTFCRAGIRRASCPRRTPAAPGSSRIATGGGSSRSPDSAGSPGCRAG